MARWHLHQYVPTWPDPQVVAELAEYALLFDPPQSLISLLFGLLLSVWPV